MFKSSGLPFSFENNGFYGLSMMLIFIKLRRQNQTLVHAAYSCF